MAVHTCLLYYAPFGSRCLGEPCCQTFYYLCVQAPTNMRWSTSLIPRSTGICLQQNSSKTHTMNNVHTNSYPFSIFMAYAFICEILCVWIPSPYQHLGKEKGRKLKKEKRRIYAPLHHC